MNMDFSGPSLRSAGAPALTVLLACSAEAPPTACLEALAAAGAGDAMVFCCCPPELEGPARAVGETLCRSGCLGGFRCLPLAPGDDRHAAVNGAAKAAESSLLLLLSSDALLEPDSLPALSARLAKEPALAGLNPVLLAPGGGAGPRRICHLGCVADSVGQLHYLYEGLPDGHPLAARRRAFQLAHEAALLVRREDFLAVGGFRPGLEGLATPDFCLRLAAARKGVFSTEPTARAELRDGFDSWKKCGLWNSLLQRGRLKPGLLRCDYHAQVQADGLEYGLTPWLAEGPCNLPLEAEKDGLDAAWLRWRHAPEPAALLRLLRLLPPQRRAWALRLCRELPSSLPRAFAWYTALAARLEGFGRRENLPRLTEQARAWQAKARRFQHEMLGPGLRALADAGIYACSLDSAPSLYDAWLELRENSLQAAERKARNLRVERTWPEIAVLMPVWNPEPEFLRAALDSVLAQSYSQWQLCLADDASTRPETPELLRACAARDKRVRLVIRERNGHISRASNSALALADAPWAAFLDHDDLLAPDALLEVARHAADRPGLRFLYSDEDKIDAAGVRRTPVFRAAFDPDSYCPGHLAAYAVAALRDAGGLRPGLEGSQDFDLGLRVTEKLNPEEIAHIPRILYHWRIHADSTTASVATKPYALEATRRALAESAQRRGLAASVLPAGKNNFFRLELAVPPGLRCSAILLADAPGALTPGLADCLRGLARRLRLETLWQPLTPSALPVNLPKSWPPRLNGRVLPPAGPHWATACRAAARAAAGDVLLFLSADLLPVGDCRPEQLAALALRPDLAVVGACVWRGGRLWHAGLYPDVTGLPFPLQRGADPALISSLCWGRLLLARRVLAVSWRCMAVRRQDFLENGGFDPSMGSLAGADYGLRREARGRFALVSPWGQWLLPAGAGEETLSPRTRQCFLERWGHIVRGHGLRNPHMRAAPDYGWTLNLSGA
ncbi:glycosyltransferase [Desulfovibrio sp. SGI.169]|uniref:glycosyltransferase n=1 Tax=Desulfovibrio sp. SGI.169 TaxID=3420561 RepID=UPI003D002936